MLMLVATGCARKSVAPGLHEAAPVWTDADRARNLESFDHVWETIRDRHFDPTFGGLDWDAVRDELRPKVEAAESVAAARVVMRDMVGRLDLSHFSVFPAAAYAALDPATEAGRRLGVPGFDVRVFDGAALVTRVVADSPAARGGVRPGWELVRVREEVLRPILAEINQQFADSSLLEARLRGAVMGRMRRNVGARVPLEFRDATGNIVKRDVTLIAPTGKPSKFGNMPTQYVEVEQRLLDSDVVYFRLSEWFDPMTVMPALRGAVRDHPDAAGFVFDLRGNPGGIGGLTMGAAGLFVGKAGEFLGTMKMRDSELRFAVNPQARRYSGPLAILVDGCSASSSEFFCGGMKDLARARVFGRTTAGAALPSVIERLPNGDGFQYATADYFRSGGKRLEGVGVTPDVEITPTRAELLAGKDPALEAATAWIQTEHRRHPAAADAIH